MIIYKWVENQNEADYEKSTNPPLINGISISKTTHNFWRVSRAMML